MKKALFDTGFKIDEIKPEIGKTYPIFGILNDVEVENGKIQAIVNTNIRAELIIRDENQLRTLMSRIFDTGIFFVEIKQITEDGFIEGFCSTIIFGKRQVCEC